MAAPEEDYKKWFVKTLKLPQYYEKFIEEGYDDMSYLLEFDIDNGDQELKDIGITKKPHRRRILLEIKKLINAKISSRQPSKPSSIQQEETKQSIQSNETASSTALTHTMDSISIISNPTDSPSTPPITLYPYYEEEVKDIGKEEEDFTEIKLDGHIMTNVTFQTYRIYLLCPYKCKKVQVQINQISDGVNFYVNRLIHDNIRLYNGFVRIFRNEAS